MVTINQLRINTLEKLQDWFLGQDSYSPQGLYVRFSSSSTNWVEVVGTNYSAFNVSSGWTYPPNLGYWGWSGSLRFKIKNDWTLPQAVGIWDHPTSGNLIATMTSAFSSTPPFIAQSGQSYCINRIVIPNFYGAAFYDTTSAQNQHFEVPKRIFDYMRGISGYTPGPVSIKAFDSTGAFWTQTITPPNLVKTSGLYYILLGATSEFYYTNPTRLSINETSSNSPSGYVIDNENNILGRLSLNICLKDIVGSTPYIQNSGLLVKIF